MAKLETLKYFTFVLLAIAGSLVNAHADSVDFETPTHKSIIGASGDKKAYFDINQARGVYLPFYVCEIDSSCVLPTEKTLKDIKPKSNELATAIKNNSYSVSFEFNSSKLTHTEFSKLLHFASSNLKDDVQIVLRGWTDPIGGKLSRKNQKLAKERVKTVKRELQQFGKDIHLNFRFDELFNPPCCNLDATKDSSDEIRKKMRIVEIDIH